MKKTLIIALFCAILVGCTTRTEYGECIGIADDKDPGLLYKLDAMNLALAIIFVETIIIPIKVAVDQTMCPVAKKEQK